MGLLSRIFFACTPSTPHRHATAPNMSIRVDPEAASEKTLDVKVDVKRQVAVPARPLVKHSLGDYNRAQRKLKRAVREHHRMLEALNNYRILNLMGFRKALEKFDKAVKTPLQLQDAYIREKVDLCNFAEGRDVRKMLKDAEEQFAACFFEGNSKAALADLRRRSARTANHFSVFVTGALLGFAFPAVASGVYQSFQTRVRADIPGWDALLFIYGVFLVPVLLLLLFGVNLLVWARLRINYVFIFGSPIAHIISIPC
ncbi:hypothetical protein PENSPDRAFT_301586 [Peniophora sp. CONT]|nr:hypothetical protein PENSPDRAFT_301586 [Peniophora sp. CONT]